MITADELIERFGLQPHPEGGYFRETYRSDERIAKNALPQRYAGDRKYGTAIYYLLTREAFSAMHRIKTDEVYHFYLGDPVELVQLLPDGSGRVITLGNDIASGAHVQTVVSRGTWHGARLAEGGRYALLGTTVSPGFEFEDFEIGDRTDLMRSYPSFRDSIIALTRRIQRSD
ncbi:MAG TPA: cupin domain-containing protein [Candidatus Acidoferrales bacterium]|nr:cupin domain-containing protein [Candidatus Acidoferrales bacterium]